MIDLRQCEGATCVDSTIAILPFNEQRSPTPPKSHNKNCRNF